MTARQLPLLAVPRHLTPSQRETLIRYGSLEVAGVRHIRLARERAAHEKRKWGTVAFAVPRLTLDRAFARTDHSSVGEQRPRRAHNPETSGASPLAATEKRTPRP